MDGCELTSILYVDIRFGEHFGEGDECEAIVGDCTKYEDYNVSNHIDLSWVAYEWFDVLDKQKYVNYVGYVVDSQSSTHQPSDSQSF